MVVDWDDEDTGDLQKPWMSREEWAGWVVVGVILTFYFFTVCGGWALVWR